MYTGRNGMSVITVSNVWQPATDIFKRGIPWMVLLLNNRDAPTDLNLSNNARLATILAGIEALCLVVLLVMAIIQRCLIILEFKQDSGQQLLTNQIEHGEDILKVLMNLGEQIIACNMDKEYAVQKSL